MTNAANLVLAGFANLSDTEQKDVLDELRKLEQATGSQQETLKRNWKSNGRVVSGPVASGCPCCGR